MTTITLQVSDQVAAQLNQLRDRLPELLAQALESWSTQKQIKVTSAAMAHPVFVEMIDFLATSPTPEQILAHKASPAVQERLEELLDQKREEGLNHVEKEELNAYLLVNHVMILLKARARQAGPSLP